VRVLRIADQHTDPAWLGQERKDYAAQHRQPAVEIKQNDRDDSPRKAAASRLGGYA